MQERRLLCSPGSHLPGSDVNGPRGDAMEGDGEMDVVRLECSALRVACCFSGRRVTGAAILSLALSVLPPVTVSAAGMGRNDFPWLKELEAPGQRSGELSAVSLDEEVFAGTDDAFSNLRLFDAGGSEIPFLRTAATRTRTVERTVEIPVRILDFKILENNRSEVTVERTDEKRELPVAELVIRSPLRNFEKDVTVSGSDDMNSWEEIAAGQAVFDYSRFLDLRNENVRLAPGRSKYLRISVSNLSEEKRAPLRRIVRETQAGAALRESETTTINTEDFRVDRIVALARTADETVTGPETRSYGVSAFEVGTDPEKKETVVRFDVNRVPVTGVKLVIRGSQFSRAARLECSDDPRGREGWQALGRGRLVRIDLARTHVDSVSFSLPGVRCRHVRVTISNGDSPPLEVSGVEVTGEAQELLFFSRDGAKYMIAYGGNSGPMPQYDIAGVLGAPPYRPGSRYVAGNGKANPEFKEPRRHGTGGGRFLMMAGVAAMVACLVWAIASAARGIEKKT